MQHSKILVTEGMEQFLNREDLSELSLNVLWEEFCEDTVNFQAHLLESQFNEVEEDALETLALARRFGYTSDEEEIRIDKTEEAVAPEKVKVPKFILEMVEYYKKNHSISDLESHEVKKYTAGIFYMAAFTVNPVSLNYLTVVSAEQRKYIRENIDNLVLGLSVGFENGKEERHVLVLQNEFNELFDDMYLSDFSVVQGSQVTSNLKDAFLFKTEEKALAIAKISERHFATRKIEVEL